MERVYVDFDHDIPRYVYTGCSHCESVIGTSLCSVINRGCCSYFPKFTLVDIHRMSKSLEGLQVLDIIRNNPLATIYQYYIHSKGFFDNSGYEDYLQKGHLIEDEIIKDHTIFFRACPFVKSGHGCTLPYQYRTYICNFFLCNEIVSPIGIQENIKPYIDERSRYAKWIDWENKSLQYVLIDNKINLNTNFDSVIEILKNTPLDIYEFPELEPIEVPDI